MELTVESEGAKLKSDTTRAGYQAALTMASAEGNMIWQKVQAFGVMNSLILVGVLGFKDPADRGIRIALSVLGLAISVLWWMILARSWAMYNFWLGWARDVERKNDAFRDAGVKLMCQSRSMLALADDFAPKHESEIKVTPFARIISVRVSTYLTVLCFGAIHAWLLLR